MAATLPASQSLKGTPMDRLDPAGPPPRRATMPWADALFALAAKGAALLTLALLVGIIVSLVIGAAPAIEAYGLSFLWRSEWDPVQN